LIDVLTILTILGMAAATVATRVGGYALLRGRDLSPRVLATMEAAPGCVLIAVIAPHFASGRSADLLALLITILVSLRLPMLPTVLVGIAAAAALRHIV
jgi:uncharacterized membrane protein